MDDSKNWDFYRVSQGILTLRDRVLLVANDYGYKDLIWSLPGGRLEPGEQHLPALKREFMEETGLEIISGELLYVVDSRSFIAHKQFVSLIFAVNLTAEIRDEPELVCELDGAVKDLKFVPFQEVPDYIPRPSLGEPLLNYLYYGKSAPRYWSYPEYLTDTWKPNRWPPGE
jgi:ADP-ribose pyrophosphatase YjhB (NUDIX family)